MKKRYLYLFALVLLFGACNSNTVKIRGEVVKLVGTVKVLAEMPGQEGLVVIAEQNVTDGSINLETDVLQIPARVWVDIAGKITLETVVDTKDQIWIGGKIQFPSQIDVKGSGIDIEYAKQRISFKERFEKPIEDINKKIQRLNDKDKKDREDEMMLEIYKMRIDRYLWARIKHSKNLIEANPSLELSLLFLRDEFPDSLDLQKRIFKKMNIANKESNLYKTLAEKLQ